MANTQDKFLKILDLLNGCREKLYGTYNLFVSNLENTKQIKLEISEQYEQLLDIKHDFTSNKQTKMRASKITRDAKNLKQECDSKFSNIGEGMSDCEKCRKTYKHEVAMCCDTFKKLATKLDSSATEKGYRQQVKLIKRILDKMEEIKANYKVVKQEIIELKQMFDDLYEKITSQTLALAN